MSAIGKNLKKLREQKGISQDRLSKLAGIPSNTVANLELDVSPNPTINILSKIGRVFTVNSSDSTK